MAYSRKICLELLRPFKTLLAQRYIKGVIKEYQMDPANPMKRLREIRPNIQEGAGHGLWSNRYAYLT